MDWKSIGSKGVDSPRNLFGEKRIPSPPSPPPPLRFNNFDATFRALVGAMKLGKETIFAQTDGGLQIVIPRKDDEGNETTDKVIYERAYYALAFEVNETFLYFYWWNKSKQFYKTRKSEEAGNTIEVDIESMDDPIHAGQIFAEMLVSISHPEFNSLDQEVLLSPNKILTLGIRGVQ